MWAQSGRLQGAVRLKCNKAVDCVKRVEVQIRRCLILFAVYLKETQPHNRDAVSPPEGEGEQFQIIVEL